MERRVIVEMNNQPLVSVPVITYNSSKFVLETLESIKAQTYQNIELIISDDCSTDNTVELCQKWVEQNKDRFVRTQIITSETNTGVSANLNRAEVACQGEWVKGIAGDDLLMPNCVKSCVDYVYQYPDVIYLFAKIKPFGAKEETNLHFENIVFDYTFFDMTIEKQLERLIFEGNCIPAATVFYNRLKAIEYGIMNDERIPLLEDWPKWINILNKGIKLHFIDKSLVRYRIHDGSLSTSHFSEKFYKSNLIFDLLYRYPEWYKRDEKAAVEIFVTNHIDIVKCYYESSIMQQKELTSIRKSYAYRLGKFLLKPLSWMRRIFKI